MKYYNIIVEPRYIKPLMPSGLPANVKIMPEFFKGKEAFRKYSLFCNAAK